MAEVSKIEWCDHTFQLPKPISAKLFEDRLKRGTFIETTLGLEKRCTVCKCYWPADTEFFHSNTAAPDGLNDRCKDCSNQSRASYKTEAT